MSKCDECSGTGLVSCTACDGTGEQNEVAEVTHIVKVDLHEILATDFEGFLDILAEKCGDPLLTEIDYKVVGSIGDWDIMFMVTGVPYREAGNA